jgi:SAM-dependent methyltransferase
MSAPFPPFDLMHRVGSLEGAADPQAEYERMGRAQANMLRDLLPDGWDWDGKRVLDFGCGAGKTLRHLTDEARVAEIWGSDIDGPSIDWASRWLSPPFSFALADIEPPLPFEEESLDLIWAFSVFTHLVETSSAWLLELHRRLAQEGVLIVTFLGATYAEEYAGELYDETRIGRNFLRCGQSWDLGGPSVLMSPWWIRAHWGRAFEFADLRDIEGGQGIAVMRKQPVQLTPADIDRPDPGESRELSAALAHAEQLSRELVGTRTASPRRNVGAAEIHSLRAELQKTRAELESVRAELAVRDAHLSALHRSRSWRLTAPLRWFGQRAGRQSAG